MKKSTKVYLYPVRLARGNANEFRGAGIRPPHKARQQNFFLP
jgi:hypothetical protein